MNFLMDSCDYEKLLLRMLNVAKSPEGEDSNNATTY